ncbi:MAG: 2Fe-2S iron-sulfur cluster binding domain-containing protein [Planctomycetes bacterium]|nr:2Fe-2S iron-sulfur cluster binding domain-containing protein [Planctomycetota bacterium]
MANDISFTIDGVEVAAAPGQTIIEAAEAAGIYIPRLCHKPGLEPFGGCRVCTVKSNGRPCSACTQPVAPGMVVENDTEELRALRRDLVELLFVEGNHFCMFCEKSGHCELQALAYRFGIAAPRFDYTWPARQVDMSHPDILVDHNRCILCGRCVRTSRQVDGKNVFQFVGRGHEKRLAVNAEADLGATDAAVTDAAVGACPVGALLKKRIGFATPVGRRPYDERPIGTDIETAAARKE